MISGEETIKSNIYIHGISHRFATFLDVLALPSWVFKYFSEFAKYFYALRALIYFSILCLPFMLFMTRLAQGVTLKKNCIFGPAVPPEDVKYKIVTDSPCLHKDKYFLDRTLYKYKPLNFIFVFMMVF